MVIERWIFHRYYLNQYEFFFRYENQREQLSNQSFNLEQQNFAVQSLKDTKTTVMNQ